MDIRFFSFPKRRLFMVILGVLFVYGIFTFIYYELGHDHHHNIEADKTVRSLKIAHTNARISLRANLVPITRRKTTAKMTVPLVTTEQPKTATPTKKKVPSVCPILSIARNNGISSENIACKEHQPSQSGCIFANKAYAYDAVRRNCNTDPRITICKITNGRFACSYKECTDGKGISIHILNKKTGGVEEFVNLNSTVAELEKMVSKCARVTIKNGFKFLFLACGKRTQMLCLNDILFTENPPSEGGNKNININVVMIDSVARGHFYRSLRKTIHAFKTINSDANPDASEVLDFKLFQALHGHSAENARGLFNGSVFPITFSDTERESNPVGIQEFYRYMKKSGYQTMYQDDMCYEGIWGFRLDIGGARDWKELYKKQREAMIDDTGLMFANCKVFEKYGANNIFNLDEDNYACYNGRQHDAYYLEYLLNYFSRYNNDKLKRAFSYTALNVAHDYGGVRIQSIDKDLSMFVESISKLDNTLTVVLADHGNTYTDFVYVDLEGKYEMFHPSLFMIIPKGVKKLLGTKITNSLRLNQNKLLTMIDLHHGFKFLADRTYPERGVFKGIPNSRKCSDLPLRFPNFCVCEGWNTAVENDTEIVGQLEFAIGKLNNIITSASPNRLCKRLVPIVFKNVLQRKDGDNQITNFEIQTHPGDGIPSKGEKINVEVTSKVSGSLTDYDMKLSSWDRVSRFAIYRRCSDVKDARFNLCVCDKELKRKRSTLEDFYYHRTSRLYNIFGGIVKEKFETIIEDNVVLVIRTYNEKMYDDGVEKTPHLISVTFEVVNFSHSNNRTYSIAIMLSGLNNIKPLTSEGCTAVLPPLSVIYVCTLSRKWNIWQAEYRYKVNYTVL